jgi:NAD(P)-dependent dehydrogenase (short-subunit alcohol dehydrogenase family)
MIIITGISSGIGTQIVKNLSQKNKILGLYHLNKPSIKIKNVKFVKVDLTKANEIHKFFKSYENRMKKIIFISLSAFKKDNLIINKSLSEWNNTIKVNLTSNFIFSKILIKKMIYHKWGRFIFFGSSIIKHDRTGISDYSSSKYGLIGLSGSISKEYGKFNITSNILELGAVKTGLYKKLSNKRKKIISNIENDNLVNVNDIINSINFIIKSSSLNNSIIKLDKGL